MSLSCHSLLPHIYRDRLTAVIDPVWQTVVCKTVTECDLQAKQKNIDKAALNDSNAELEDILQVK